MISVAGYNTMAASARGGTARHLRATTHIRGFSAASLLGTTFARGRFVCGVCVGRDGPSVINLCYVAGRACVGVCGSLTDENTGVR